MNAYRIISLIVLSSLFLAACGGANSPTTSPNATALPPVISDAAVVSQGRLFPQQYADISFNASGRVAEVLVKEGDPVQAGQVIARLESSEADETAVARAQKDALTLLQARLEEAELRARLAWETAELLRDRFAKIPERHRPHFTPAQRFRVLEIRSLLAWNARETARLFLLCTNTVLNWENLGGHPNPATDGRLKTGHQE